MKVWEEGPEFRKLLMEAPEIGEYLNKKEIEEIFDLDYHLKNVDGIFKKVFG